MEFLFKIICPILLLASTCFSFHLRDQYRAQTKELTYKIDEFESNKAKLESRVKILSERERNLAEKASALKADLNSVSAELEKSNAQLADTKKLFREKSENLENIKKLLSDAEKRAKNAERDLAETLAKHTVPAEVKEKKQFVVTQDVYLKRFQNIISRLNANLALARAKDPDKGKRGNASGMGSLSSESALAHVRAAEKAQKELEAANKPSQKLYSAITAEKQRWANEKTRWEYLPQCSSQLYKDTAQFLSQTPTYLDESL